MNKTLLCCLLLLPTICLAQKKYEKEIRISSKEAPTSATAFIEKIPFPKKIKWYKEFGIDTISFEAKTKYQRQRHSIEFSDTGILEDVEVQVKYKVLPEKVRAQIASFLAQKHGKYKVRKTQIQYSGPEEAVTDFLTDAQQSQDLLVRYELIVTSKEDRVFKKYEYLFSDSGELIKVSEVIEKNTDNIEY